MNARLVLVLIVAGMAASARAQTPVSGLQVVVGNDGGVRFCVPPELRQCYALVPLPVSTSGSPPTPQPTAGAAGGPVAASTAAVAGAPSGAGGPTMTVAAAPAASSASGEAGPKSEPAATKEQKTNAFKLFSDYAQSDISVPSSPAFAILGITPDKIQRPGSIRDFVASAARGLGEDGKPVNGLAIDVSPVSLFFRDLVTGGRGYTDDKAPKNDLSPQNYWKRLLARTTVSFGSTGDEKVTGASRLAWGLRMGLIDFADPGLYWQTTVACLRKATMPPIPAGKTLDPTPANDEVEKCNPQNNADEPLWAKPSLYLGLGQSWYSATGSLSNRSHDSTAVWLSGSWGLGSKAANKDSDAVRTLLQGYVARMLNERTPDPSDSTSLLRKDTSEFVLRLRAGKEKWHTFVDWGRSRVRLGNDATKNIRHVAVGAEFKVAMLGDDSWIQLASVQEKGFADGKDKTGVTLNLKFGMPFLQIPGPPAQAEGNAAKP